MRTINPKTIHEAVVNLIKTCSTNLPPDVYHALVTAHTNAERETSKEVFRQLIENADYAAQENMPLCQDCGTAIFFIDRGEKLMIEGDKTLREIINGAVIEAYDVGNLRKSMCDPLTRENTGDNTPAIIYADMVAGDGLIINFLAKGGGSENMSAVTMLSPSQGIDRIKSFVVERVAQAGPNPCPPITIGIGIGGTFETVPIIAKKTLMRDLDDTNADPELAALEDEILKAVNTLGIGPMGLGGRLTAFAVKIAKYPCHIASLPLAVNIQCHSIRHGRVEL